MFSMVLVGSGSGFRIQPFFDTDPDPEKWYGFHGSGSATLKQNQENGLNYVQNEYFKHCCKSGIIYSGCNFLRVPYLILRYIIILNMLENFKEKRRILTTAINIKRNIPLFCLYRYNLSKKEVNFDDLSGGFPFHFCLDPDLKRIIPDPEKQFRIHRLQHWF